MNRQNFLFNAAMASGGAVLTFGGFMRRAEAFRETKNFAPQVSVNSSRQQRKTPEKLI